SFVSGQLVSRTGRYRWNVVLGPLALTAGMLLLWRMNVHTTNGEAARNMVVAGIGIGSLTQFARQMGATIGVTIMGAIVNSGLPAGATARGTQIHLLPRALRSPFAAALKPAFLAAACVSALVWLVAVLWVKEVTLRRSVDEVAAAEAAAGTPNPGIQETRSTRA